MPDDLSEWEKGAMELNHYLKRFIVEGRAHVKPTQMPKWFADAAKLEPMVKEASAVLQKEIAENSAGGKSPLYRSHDSMIDLAEPWIRNFPDPWRDTFRDALDGIDMYPGYDDEKFE